MTYRILYHHRIRAEDGQAVHVREMIGALRAAGHEVMECALVPKAAGPGANGSTVGRGFWQRLELPRVATECTEILYSYKGRAMLLAAARGFRPDFVYERHALHCRAGLHAARKLDVPLVLEVNAPMCDEMERLGMLHFGKMARQTERAVLAGADRVLPVSDVLAARLVELGAAPEKIRVVRNGADPARVDDAARQAGRELRARLGLDAAHFVVGFIGFMRPWHRLELVLEAMRVVGEHNVHLVMLGDGPALAGLLQHAAALGLTDRVHSLGKMPPAAVPAVCSAFDVALVPAINEYASPLKLFDSLAAGVATLALDQPNIREVLVDGATGILFPPGDVTGLTARLGELAADPRRAHAIGEAGRAALVENDWTWRGSAARVIEAFEELR